MTRSDAHTFCNNLEFTGHSHTKILYFSLVGGAGGGLGRGGSGGGGGVCVCVVHPMDFL